MSIAEQKKQKKPPRAESKTEEGAAFAGQKSPETAKPSPQPVSSAVINRLPRYYRYLGDLLQKEVGRISSRELSAMMGVTSSQVRQDFNCFGGFGQQGYGYNVKYLHTQIAEILGVTDHMSAVIVGVGNLGRALIGSPMFSKRNVTIVGVFDRDPALIGTVQQGYTVMDIATAETFLSEVAVDIGVITVPRAEAASTALLLCKNGVRGLWNFSNTEMDQNTLGVPIENVHMGDSLMKLMFSLTQQKVVFGSDLG